MQEVKNIKFKTWVEIEQLPSGSQPALTEWYKEHLAGKTFYACNIRADGCATINVENESLEVTPEWFNTYNTKKPLVVEQIKDIYKKLESEGRSLMDGVPEPRGASPALAAPYGQQEHNKLTLKELPAHAEIQELMKVLSVNDNPFRLHCTKSQLRLIIRGLETLFDGGGLGQMIEEDIVDMLYEMKGQLEGQQAKNFKANWIRNPGGGG